MRRLLGIGIVLVLLITAARSFAPAARDQGPPAPSLDDLLACLRSGDTLERAMCHAEIVERGPVALEPLRRQASALQTQWNLRSAANSSMAAMSAGEVALPPAAERELAEIGMALAATRSALAEIQSAGARSAVAAERPTRVAESTTGSSAPAATGFCALEQMPLAQRDRVCGRGGDAALLTGGIACDELAAVAANPATFVPQRFFCVREEAREIADQMRGMSRREAARFNDREARERMQPFDVAAWVRRNAALPEGAYPDDDPAGGVVIAEADYSGVLHIASSKDTTSRAKRVMVVTRTTLGRGPIVVYTYRAYERPRSVADAIGDAHAITRSFVAADG